MLQSWEEINWVDQVLHIVIGALLVGLAVFVMPWWAGLLASMTVCLVREMLQHPWRFGPGSLTDILCWGIGSLAGLCMLFVR